MELPGFENEHDRPWHVPVHIAGRLINEVTKLRRADHIGGLMFWSLDNHLRALMDVCGACEKIRNTPPAPSYRALSRAGPLLNVLAQPWLTITDYSFRAIPSSCSCLFLSFGVEPIDTVVEEPFGTERDDLDMDRYCQTIRESERFVLPSAAAVAGTGA